jgi:hypothetical protein
MPVVNEDDGILEIQEHMTWGRRGFFFLLGCFPLIAPYQLLIQTKWISHFNFLFLLSLLISLGAIALSGFLFFAAFAGLSTSLIFNRHTQVFTYIRYAPIVPYRRESIAFDAINSIEIDKHDWSDGPPSYSIKVNLHDGRTFKSSSFDSLDLAEDSRNKAQTLVTHHQDT